ncbi:MAG: type II secretion system protein [Opitutales bacterium]|nr:type II secretion system protein [Opitutales bacterium]
MKRLSRRAFTLIEVVVAIAIFAVTAGTLLAAIGNAYAAQSSLSKRDSRHEDRREIMRILLAESENDSDKLDAGGDYESLDGEKASWSAEAEETPQAGLFRVTVFVDWDKDSETESFFFYAFRPDWKSQFDNQEVLLEDLREIFPLDRFDTF